MALSFASYDSAEFPTIEESIANSKTNPFLLNNFSDKLVALVEGQNTIVYEPYNVLQSFVWMLDDFLVTYPMPPDEYYMPEKTAKRLYDSHDFWYICMLINNVSNAKDYRFETYKVLPAENLYHIETFLDRAKGELRVYTPEADTVFK